MPCTPAPRSRQSAARLLSLGPLEGVSGVVAQGELVAALKAGREAYAFGAVAADCPYPAGDPRHAAWLRGLAAAREQATAKGPAEKG